MDAPNAMNPASLEQRLARVELVAFDVDGTLTRGEIVYGNSEQLQQYDVRDGLGIVELRRAGIRVAWITGRGCAATERRAKELSIDELRMDSGPKREVLAQIQAKLGVEPSQTCAMGDDLPDLALFERAAVKAAPADAAAEVLAAADFRAKRRGGRGAARDLAEALLRARGVWDEVVARYAGWAGVDTTKSEVRG